MDNTKKSFVKGAAILGVAGLIVKIIGAVYRIPLTNILQQGGLDGMTFYETAYPYYSWLLVISSAGFPTAISKLVSERIARGDGRGAANVFATAMRLMLIIGVVTTAVLFFCSPALESLSKLDGARYSFMALAPSLLIVSIMCAYRGYLQGMQMMVGTALSQIAEQVGKLIAGYALALMFVELYPTRPEFWAMGTLIGISISEFIALIVIYCVYRKKRSQLPNAMIEGRYLDKASFKKTSFKLLTIAVPITIGASIMPITGIADSIFIRSILTDNYVGVGFAVEDASTMANNAFVALRSYVTPLINMPAVLTLALSMSLVPAIAERIANRDAKGVRKAGATGMKLALLVGAPCAAGLFILGGPIMALLFSKVGDSTDYYAISGFISRIVNIENGAEVSLYTLSGGIMQIAAIGVLFLSLVQTMTGVIQGMGKQRIPVYFLVVGGVLKVASMLLLMKYTSLGILGAAISTVVCYVVAGICDAAYAVVKSGIRLRLFDTFGKPLISAAVMGVAVYYSYEVIYGIGHPTFATLGSVCIGVAVYVIMLRFLRAFNENDMEFMPGGRRLARILGVKLKTK